MHGRTTWNGSARRAEEAGVNPSWNAWRSSRRRTTWRAGWPRPSIRKCSRKQPPRVRLRVEPRTWDAFQLLAIEGRSGAEVAQRLQMKVATVFVARSKVQRMLREEVSRLDRE